LPKDFAAGFSLMELLVSVAIIALLMSAVFPFLFQSQKKYQDNLVVSEANQSARAALEVMSQEIGQAGFNPNFTSAKTSSVVVVVNSSPQCLTLSDINQINPGDWVSVDTGPNYELVQVLSTSTVSGTPCSSPNQISAVFLMNHNGSTTPFPVISYKMPYGSGILQNTGTSNGQRLEFFGDINQDGIIHESSNACGLFTAREQRGFAIGHQRSLQHNDPERPDGPADFRLSQPGGHRRGAESDYRGRDRRRHPQRCGKPQEPGIRAVPVVHHGHPDSAPGPAGRHHGK
jgi:prepilin-type N-terminal cleavage/methylation domain-containing protein